MSDVPEIVDQLRQSTDFQINQTILREKIQTDLHFTYEGGLFKATPELIAFVQVWYGDNQSGYRSQMFMEDTYGNPILINSISEFSRIACRHYETVMNTWHQQHAELKRIRKV
jgi:hypothetical protein